MKTERRLIDANALDELGELPYVYNPVADGSPWYRANDVWDCIEGEPTVDAVEVVHGWWVDRGDFMCSICGTEEEYVSRYCPNCGARMDGKPNEN